MQTQVLGLSVDSVPCLKAWADSLGGITYPLLSDFYPHGRVATEYGVLRLEGHSERALFIVDKRGIIRYVDVHDIDQQPDNEVLFAALETIEPTLAPRKPAQVEEYQVPEANIVMFCTPWCPDCRRARTFFLDHGIKFVEIDISRNRPAANKVRSWNNGSETTPTFYIGGQAFTGFDEARLRKLLHF